MVQHHPDRPAGALTFIEMRAFRAYPQVSFGDFIGGDFHSGLLPCRKGGALGLLVILFVPNLLPGPSRFDPIHGGLLLFIGELNQIDLAHGQLVTDGCDILIHQIVFHSEQATDFIIRKPNCSVQQKDPDGLWKFDQCRAVVLGDLDPIKGLYNPFDPHFGVTIKALRIVDADVISPCNGLEILLIEKVPDKNSGLFKNRIIATHEWAAGLIGKNLLGCLKGFPIIIDGKVTFSKLIFIRENNRYEIEKVALNWLSIVNFQELFDKYAWRRAGATI